MRCEPTIISEFCVARTRQDYLALSGTRSYVETVTIETAGFYHCRSQRNASRSEEIVPASVR